jgi:hypothetical protein
MEVKRLSNNGWEIKESGRVSKRGSKTFYYGVTILNITPQKETERK